MRSSSSGARRRCCRCSAARSPPTGGSPRMPSTCSTPLLGSPRRTLDRESHTARRRRARGQLRGVPARGGAALPVAAPAPASTLRTCLRHPHRAHARRPAALADLGSELLPRTLRARGRVPVPRGVCAARPRTSSGDAPSSGFISPAPTSRLSRAGSPRSGRRARARSVGRQRPCDQRRDFSLPSCGRGAARVAWRRGRSCLHQMSDSVLAAIIAGTATLSASFLQLRSVALRDARPARRGRAPQESAAAASCCWSSSAVRWCRALPCRSG